MAAMQFSDAGGKEGNVWGDTSTNSNGGVSSEKNGAGSPTGHGVPAAGAFATCHACTTARVSRSVTCQGCEKTFHWTCMGFYEHKYQRPGPNWRCKDCKTAEAGGEGEAASPAALATQAVQLPESGEAIDVDDSLATPPETARL
ncbi:unnamed protein product, partial [Ectocarpus sp. 13 AM-2016]